MIEIQRRPIPRKRVHKSTRFGWGESMKEKYRRQGR